MTDDEGLLPAPSRSQTSHKASATSTNRKRKSTSQIKVASIASDEEDIAAPSKKMKTSSNSKAPVKRPAPRPIPKKSTSANTTKKTMPLDRAAAPEGFLTPVHPSKKATGKIVNQHDIPESRAPSLRRTGISLLG